MTILFLHAHPDDECILTGSVIAKAKHLGFRVIVAYATRGDAGETNAELGTESLGNRREREALAACSDLGVDRVEFLGYRDSGMAGTETAEHPDAFCNLELDDIAVAIGELLADEDFSAVVGYDRNGTYGHPDHVQIHHAAHAAAPVLGADWVFDATYNREYLAELNETPEELDESFATAAAQLTHFVSGEDYFLAKMKAIANHTSQIPDDWDVDNPDIDGFRRRFGTEWFVARSLRGQIDLGDLRLLFEPKQLGLGN